MSDGPPLGSGGHLRPDHPEFYMDEAREAHQRGEVDAILSYQKDSTTILTIDEVGQPYRILVEAMCEGAATTAADGTILFANQALARMVGKPLERLIGSPVIGLVVTTDAGRFGQWISLGPSGPAKAEFLLAAEGGRSVPILASACGLGPNGNIGLILSDLTETKAIGEERLAIEKKMLQSQKLESLGVLAGGIAHDFNNILTVIMGHVELGILGIEPDSPAHRNFGYVRQATQRAAELVRQMLAYAGKARFVVQPLDVNEVLSELLPMLEVSIAKNVSLIFDQAPDPLFVMADKAQLNQVFMNFAINASEAMEGRAGRIRVGTGAVEYEKEDLSAFDRGEEAPPGPYVLIEFSDNGCGMTAEVISKLFDPFFTTKSTGRGLGMSAVQGIVRSHGGLISVTSQVGMGSRFSVLIPRVAAPMDGEQKPAAYVETTRSRKILVVDDEDFVRSAAASLLEALSVNPITAKSGEEAIDLVSMTKDIDGVILDLCMPGMGGAEALKRIRLIRPRLPIVVSSGYGDLEVYRRLEECNVSGFLQKPYRMDQLQEALRVLGQMGPE